jgi:rare lipoprotein A
VYQRGNASWYGPGFHGNRTANGERFDQMAMTAAHRTLPFNTHVQVRNLDNGRRLVVRINDRGPFIRGRIIDCSRGAARKLDFERAGVARVELRILGASPKDPKPEPERRSEPPPVLEPVDPDEGPFDVQVGAFSDHDNARRFQRELELSFPRVHLVRFAEYLRVRVGPYRDRAGAESAQAELLAMGHPGFVTRHDPEEE